jgi:hypothetical protein
MNRGAEAFRLAQADRVAGRAPARGSSGELWAGAIGGDSMDEVSWPWFNLDWNFLLALWC